MNGIGFIVCAVCGWPVFGSTIVSQLPWSAVMKTVASTLAAASTMRPMHVSIVSMALDGRLELAGVPDHVGVGVVDEDERRARPA